jgi:hypothetical protein
MYINQTFLQLSSPKLDLVSNPKFTWSFLPLYEDLYLYLYLYLPFPQVLITDTSRTRHTLRPWTLTVNLRTTADFIQALWHIMLDDSRLRISTEAVKHLWNPLCDDPSLSVNENTKLVLWLFLNNPSAKTYKNNCGDILLCHLDDALPSYYKIKHLVADMTGIESVIHDICINLCIVYMGPFLELETCPICSEAQYELSKSQSSSRSQRKL